MSHDHAKTLALLGGVALMAFGLFTRGCVLRRDDDRTPIRDACTACHGSSERAGSALDKSAPPVDLNGNQSPSSPGVGAHAIHLSGSETHGAVACAECHVVPAAVDSPGHADDGAPAELTPGPLASLGGLSPSYDATARTCGGTYCHRTATPVWNEPRSSEQACGTCHGLPPAAPHPQRTDCADCHGVVIANSGKLIRPELHVDGLVQLDALACHTCHGTASSNAPPPDLSGNLEPTAVGVGAHQAHLAGGQHSRALGCGECHEVPATVTAVGHLDAEPNAEVIFSGLAAGKGTTTTWDRDALTCNASHCHGPSAPATSVSPVWTSTAGPLGCTGCHGQPPAAPHPQVPRCSVCHAAVVAPDDVTILDRSLHVNGVVDVNEPASCSACHGGSTSAAPPTDVAGHGDTAFRGVGAHQTHVLGTGASRPVACVECHQVPTAWKDAGHVDSALPAELAFTGVALAHGAQPVFDGQRCQSTYCHGASFVNGNPSGGANTAPEWTSVGTGEAACGACHDLPPPAPHPQGVLQCSNCHKNLNGTAFLDPSLHVNGVVEQ